MSKKLKKIFRIKVRKGTFFRQKKYSPKLAKINGPMPAYKGPDVQSSNLIAFKLDLEKAYAEKDKRKSCNYDLALTKVKSFMRFIENSRKKHGISMEMAGNCLAAKISVRAYRTAVRRAFAPETIQGRPKSKYGQLVEPLYKEFSTEHSCTKGFFSSPYAKTPKKPQKAHF